MLDVKSEGIILEKTNLGFENEAVFNPSCVKVGNIIHMYYRAVQKGNISSIGYCQLENNKVIKRLPYPLLKSEYDYEKHGVEDPRVVYLDGLYYLFYTAYDGENALVAYATSSDLINFTKKGIISPKITYREAKEILIQSKAEEKYILFADKYLERVDRDVLLWEKDSFLFPKKINGKFALIHRILPEIQIIYFNDFPELTNQYWREYFKDFNKHIVIDTKFWFESRNVGGGCPPIETENGWLLIYHGVENSLKGKVYHASAALLDLNDPTKVIGRLNEPLFSPQEPWEKDGIVSNVVFPTGAIVQDDRIYIYYGAADQLIAAKSVNLKELLRQLTSPDLSPELV